MVSKPNMFSSDFFLLLEVRGGNLSGTGDSDNLEKSPFALFLKHCILFTAALCRLKPPQSCECSEVCSDGLRSFNFFFHFLDDVVACLFPVATPHEHTCISVVCEFLSLQPRDSACGSGHPSLHLSIAAYPDGHRVELGLMGWMFLPYDSLCLEFAFLSLTIENVKRRGKKKTPTKTCLERNNKQRWI